MCMVQARVCLWLAIFTSIKNTVILLYKLLYMLKLEAEEVFVSRLSSLMHTKDLKKCYTVIQTVIRVQLIAFTYKLSYSILFRLN